MLLGYADNRFILQCSFEERHYAQSFGFTWDEQKRYWYMTNMYEAYCVSVYRHISVKPIFDRLTQNIRNSSKEKPVLPGNPKLYPFQQAGVEVVVNQLKKGRKAVLLADEQGLGKTIEAIEVANEMGYPRILVICPATLRLNWIYELNKWHRLNHSAVPILSGSDTFDSSKSVVTSYELIDNVKDYKPDLIIIDEAHRIKNTGAIRTQKILGNNNKDIKGIVDYPAKVLLLTGTPAPNGKPNELWPVLYKLAGGVIGYLKYYPFINKYCNWVNTGEEDLIKGARKDKTQELSVRLRGSGFMVRRLKKDVLKDLPPKRFKMVIFPQDETLHRIIEKESEFNHEEIMKHGIPLGSAIPELRREMGIAKVPQAVDYIKLLLEGGDKVVVFAHHRQVVEELAFTLERYGPLIVYGGMTAKHKDTAVRLFQTKADFRVIIGNEAMEEGLTLTASHILVSVEPEWVPAKEMQRADRLHRISQTKIVEVHVLVVEKSIDAKILGSAAYKAQDFNFIFN